MVDAKALADRSRPELEDMICRLTAQAERVERTLEELSQTLERQEDGSLIVRFRAGGDLEMAWHLCIRGDKVEVLEPPRLADLINGQRRAWPALP